MELPAQSVRGVNNFALDAWLAAAPASFTRPGTGSASAKRFPFDDPVAA